MDNNLNLIEEINKQRESNRLLKQAVQSYMGKVRHLAQAQFENEKKMSKKGRRSLSASLGQLPTAGIEFPSLGGAEQHQQASGLGTGVSTGVPGTSIPAGVHSAQSRTTDDPMYVLDKNRFRIAALKGAIAELESRVQSQKAYSREVLPPMDGATAPNMNPSNTTDGIFSPIKSDNPNSNSKPGSTGSGLGQSQSADVFSSTDDQLMV